MMSENPAAKALGLGADQGFSFIGGEDPVVSLQLWNPGKSRGRSTNSCPGGEFGTR
jgi:hypothetical protein